MNLYSRDRSRDNQALNLARAFKDRVSIRVALKLPDKMVFLKSMDPQMSEMG
jgi:hypothetical protein